MNLMSLVWVLAIAALGFVGWRGRHLTTSRGKRIAILGCRMAAIGALIAATAAAPHQRTAENARRIVYLIDGSASIDPAQQAWIVNRVASLELVRPSAVEHAIMVFGRQAELAAPLRAGRPLDPRAVQHAMISASIDPASTNLESALLSALAQLGSQRGGRIVLFSDGRETAGNVTELLPLLRRAGVEIFSVPVPSMGRATTVWEHLVAPPIVQRGAAIPIELVIHQAGSKTRAGQLSVAMEGVTIKQQSVAVRPGWQVIALTVPAVRRGTTALDVRLSIPEESLEEARRIYTEVEGPPRLLVVTDQVADVPAVATALKRREMDVELARPQDVPITPEALLDYDAVVLFHLPKSSLSQGQADALARYLERFGGGLVTVGLGGELATEITTPAPLDPVLPVVFEPKGLQEAKRRVCMVLLIDRSASMMGPRIAATKRAAVELVKQLSPEDLVGIYAFDTQPYVVVEIQPARQVGQWLIDKLVKLKATGGTDVLPALTTAAERLAMTGATVNHIILLSDGNTPVNAGLYRALFQAFRTRQISVSTIGIGSAFINVDYLQWVSRETGGTYYPLRDLNELPKLIVRDTQNQLERLPFSEGQYQPVKSPTTDWFAQTTEFPRLRGFLTATAKPGARVDLIVRATDEEYPLLARWQLGQGRVVSWTSDSDTRWSPEWIRWNGFDRTWAEIVRWASRQRLTEELFVSVEQRSGKPLLVLEGDLADPQATIVPAERPEASMRTEPPGRMPLSLIQTGPWRWQASLEQVPSGWYQLLVEASSAAQPAPATNGQTRAVATRWIRIGTPPADRELPGQPPYEPLLRQVAQATSGMYDMPDQAFLPVTTTVTTAVPAFTWWIPFALLALLGDVALRGSSLFQ